MIYSAYLILNKMRTVYIQYILGIKIRPVYPSHNHVISHGYPQVLKDICRIYHNWYSIYHVYDNLNIEDNFEDNFRKSVISMSHTLYANG